MSKFMVVTGNPIDGFTFIGPFDDHGDAIGYAELFIPLNAWWVTELEEPETLPNEEAA